jgi:putative MATE family efflux protein
MGQREKQLATEDISKLIVKFSIPGIIGMMVNALYNIVDRIYIGKIPGEGARALTGVGLTFPISTIILAFSLLVGVGTSARISILLGQKRHKDAEELLGTSLLLAIGFGVLITILGLIFLDPILYAFGASEATFPYAKNYIRIILAFSIINTCSFSMNHGIRGSGNPRRSAMTQMVGAIVNIILDPVFIFVLNMGVQGAAIATIIGQATAAALVFSYYLSESSNVKLRFRNLRLNQEYALKIFSIGMSPFSMQLSSSAVGVVVNNTLRAYGGDLAIGAMTAITSIFSLCFMPVLGMNQGLQPIIGYNYGAGNYPRVKKALEQGILAATCITSFFFLLTQLFPKWIISLFNNDPQLLEIGAHGIRIYMLMSPLVAFQVLSTNYFQSIGRAAISMFLSLLRQVILLIPLYFILPRFLGLKGIWISTPVSDTIAILVTAFLIWRAMKDLTRKETQLVA